MTNDKLYEELVQKMTEISEVTPQQVGPFTSVYKRVTPYMKKKPLKVLSISSFIIAGFLYVLLGSFVIKLVSLLQYGF